MKSIFKSKTFWFNILAGGLQFLQIIPINPKYSALIAAGINIVLRYITENPVTLTGD